MDGVYRSAQESSIFSFNNVDRIEVLRGPQGTLFGRNAMGGVVQIITRTPQQTPSADVSLSYGSYDRWRMRTPNMHHSTSWSTRPV